MERKFKDLAQDSIIQMMEDMKKKEREGRSDPRDAGILLALEFELDIRKNEGKFINVEQLERIQQSVARLYEELIQIDMITVTSQKAIPCLTSLRDNLKLMEQYVSQRIDDRQKVNITDVVG